MSGSPDVMAHGTDNEMVLQARGLSKSFPGVQALEGVHLDVARGEVHALVGENGAGKSTLMKILAGLHPPDRGEILFQGRPARIANPHHALKLGISMIHQELMPFPDLSVAENIFMGQEPAGPFPGWIAQGRLRRAAQPLLDRLGVAIPPGQTMRELSVAAMQTVEIAKAMAHCSEVIIMDEPTSALSEREVEALFAVIRDLKRHGVAVIYISHRLEEVFRIADRVTVLRDGRHVATCGIGELGGDRLIALMVGRAVCCSDRRTNREAGAPISESARRGTKEWDAPNRSSALLGERSDAALSVRGLSKAGQFRDVSFEVRRGEILGLAGLMGAGRTQIVSALYGLAPADAGEILVSGRRVRIRNPRDAIAHGLALVSEDRKEYGLVLKMSVTHNLTLSSLRRCCRGPFIGRRLENELADERIRTFSIKTPSRDQPANHLSGGNQQKVVIAKALLTDPDILILDEPTRGIDIGAKAEVHAIITALARQGKAVLMVSSELPEVLSLSDRLLVLREGTITAELNPRQTTPEEVLKFAMPV